MAISADDRIEKTDFTAKIFSELKSRLHARFVQYEVFTFAEKAASISLHLTNTNVTVKLPYLIMANGKDDYTLFFRSNELSGSLSSLISYMLTTMRREESKLSRFKKAT